MGMFDDLIPGSTTPQPDAPKGLDFSDLLPNNAAQASEKVTPEPAETPGIMERAGILGRTLLSQSENILHGAAQGTDPNTGDRQPLGPVSSQDDAGNYYFKDATGKQQRVDLSKQNLLRDPSGNLSVYARDPNYDESGLKGAGRIIAQGLITSPLTGPAQSTALALPQATNAAEQAGEAAQDLGAFSRAGVAPPPGAFSSGPTRGLVKSIGETPVIGTPIDRAIENTYTGLRSAADDAAANLSDVTTPREAGQTIQTGINRFKDARPEDVVEDSIRLPANATPEQVADSNQRLSEIIAAPASNTSLKTKQAALYERAWRAIPQEMQQGRAVTDAPRVMQNPSNTRAVIQDIVGRNARMTLQSGANAAPDSALNPVQGGLLGRMIEAIQNPRWTANLQTLRDMRSEIRRLASGMPDTERNTLKTADLSRIQMGLSRDITALLARNALHYQAAGDTARAAAFTRSIRQFQQADTFTRLSMGRMENIEKLFKADSPEALARNVTNAALAGGKGNFDMLNTLSKTLRPDEMNDVRSSIFNEMFKPLPSARGIPQQTGFSAQSFLTRWRGMSDEAKALLFPGDHGRAIDDIARMSSRLANVESMANVSRSGVNALNVGGLLGGIGMVVHGDVMTPLAMLGGGAAASFLLSRPLYARWAAQMLNLKAASLAAPGRLNAEIGAHIARLSQLARRDPDLIPVLHAISRENGISEGDQSKDQEAQPSRPPQAGANQ